ncbi:hypothetical protein CTAYLR_007858 [Chrysophaeum taylorii]|uniref:Multidrug and toxic compound extrusion protein n=1 Tax=Chrysophaeum taylorii TaxID=2483200 RepID=A0AAD7UE18_9STRA|nr:hypothetical protein CTAYLR_007858 [Chrysophaeum taylorii]
MRRPLHLVTLVVSLRELVIGGFLEAEALVTPSRLAAGRAGARVGAAVAEERLVREDVPALFRGRSNTAAVWKVAWPAVSIGLLRTALGQVDAYQIGRLGSVELQAIGAASFAVWLVYILGELSSVGVHALSSEAEGAGDRGAIASAIAQGLWFSLLTSVLTAALASRSAIAAYFRLVGVSDPKVAEAGNAYVRVTAAWGALPLSASACASAGFKGIGETRAALVIAALCVVLNAGLNCLLIPPLGVAGAAWATNIAAAIACVTSLVVLRRDFGVAVVPRRPSLRAMRQIAAIGTPLASSGALFSFVYIILGRFVASVDPLYLASLGVGHRLEAVAYTVGEGYAVGTATVVGQWLGTKRPKDARRAADAAARVAIATMVPIALLTLAFAPSAAAFFADDPMVSRGAASYLRIVAFVFPLMAVESVFEGACLGAQQTLSTFLITLVGSGMRIPLALLLLRHLGVDGIWAAIALTTLFKAPAKYLAFQLARLDGEDPKRPPFPPRRPRKKGEDLDLPESQTSSSSSSSSSSSQ